jgi:hypothetical protein
LRFAVFVTSVQTMKDLSGHAMRTSWVFVCGVVGVVAACQSETPKASRDWQRYPAIATVTGAGEIYVMGDLHGDIEATTRVLASAGLITTTAPRHWNGGSRVLVVTGDVIDKGSAATQIIDLMLSLEPEAEAAGGKLIVTLGNHEAEFVADPTSDKVQEFRDELQSTKGLDPKTVAAGQTKYGEWLLTRPVAAQIDDWFFCHGGNTGGLSASQIDQAFRDRFTGRAVPDFGHPFLSDGDSLLEASGWWMSSDPAGVIDFNLAVLPASHLVFGHEPGTVPFPDDPQGTRTEGEMAARYGGRIFMVDVGMSHAVGYSNGALLRIMRGPDSATAVFPDGSTKALWP